MILFQKGFSMSQNLIQDISIGENLRNLRRRAGLSQEQVAAQLELSGISISREIISQMERGTHHIRISVLLALKKLYHASYEEIFDSL